MLAVFGFASGSNTKPVAYTQCKLHRPIRFEPLGKLDRRADAVFYHKP
jgi:hypothetical protein